MSFHDRTRTITKGVAALEYFTNRSHACRLFASYLNDDPPHESILFFRGDGGNGKSLLLKFLRERYCKRIDARDWETVKAAEDEAFAALFGSSGSAEPVPSALLDFAPLPGGDESHQGAFAGLLKLRRELTGHGLHFPLFDFACLLRLQRTEGITQDSIRKLFPAEELNLVAAVVDLGLSAVGFTPVGALSTVVLGVLSKHFGAKPNEWFTMWMQQRGLDADQVEALRRMDPDRELVEVLPELFAEDLNAAMAVDGAPKRVVLFFDTHEAFWGDPDKQKLVHDRFFERDEWLRSLLKTLKLERGLAAVVAGRVPPQWARANEETRITNLDLQLVDSLSDAHAREYLERAVDVDAALRECLVEYARVGVNQIHPLYLGLCADIVRAAKAQEKTLTPDDFQSAERVADKGQELIRRLLSYVDGETDYAVRALSAARAFNQGIYRGPGRCKRLRGYNTEV